MTDQQIPETGGDDEFPPVHFELRNTTGEATEIELHQPILGMELYVLIQPGDEAVQVTASHLGLNDLAQSLTFVLLTLLEADEISQETRALVSKVFAEEEA